MANKKTPRPITIGGDVALIPLTQDCVALVDAQDAYLFEGFNWYAKKGRRSMYAARNVQYGFKSRGVVYLHHVLLPKRPGFFADHKNGDGLDNRRSNLRYATAAQNARNIPLPAHNTSGFKGVTWLPATSRWVAQIRVDGKLRQIGQFEDRLEAADAYVAAAKEYHKDFARA